MQTIRDRYEEVLDQITKVCQRSNRVVDDVKIVVVTKKQPIERVKEIIEAGAHLLGENHPEVIDERIESLTEIPNIEWHMIGHIQSRKVKFLDQFHVIHSIDSVELLQRINRTVQKQLPVLIEVNVSGEASKQGFDLFERSDYDSISALITETVDLEKCRIVGFMCMPPLVEVGEQNRPFFRKCRELLEYVRDQTGLSQLKELSMGTSNDYQVAIEEGATYLRVGEKIMGSRLEK